MNGHQLIVQGFSHVQDLDELTMNRLYAAVGRATANSNSGHQLILVPLWTCMTQMDWDKLDALARGHEEPTHAIEGTLEVILNRVAKITIVNPGDPVLKEACVITASTLGLDRPLDLRACVVCARRLSKNLTSDIRRALAHPPRSWKPSFSTLVLHLMLGALQRTCPARGVWYLLQQMELQTCTHPMQLQRNGLARAPCRFRSASGQTRASCA